MLTRMSRSIIESILLLFMTSYLRIALGATATAIVSVTVLEPSHDASGLTLFPLQLDMREKLSEELVIINHSDIAREIHVDVTPPAMNANCTLHFSPMSSSLPPQGRQVVRLSFLTANNRYCTTNHDLLIRDKQSPENLLFTVPIQTTG